MQGIKQKNLIFALVIMAVGITAILIMSQPSSLLASAEDDSTSFGYSGHQYMAGTYQVMLEQNGMFEGSPILAGSLCHVLYNDPMLLSFYQVGFKCSGIQLPAELPIYGSLSGAFSLYLTYSTITNIVTFTDGSRLYTVPSEYERYRSGGSSSSPRYSYVYLSLYFEDVITGTTYHLIDGSSHRTDYLGFTVDKEIASILFTSITYPFLITSGMVGDWLYEGDNVWNPTDIDPSQYTTPYQSGYYEGFSNAIENMDISDVLTDEADLLSDDNYYYLNIEGMLTDLSACYSTGHVVNTLFDNGATSDYCNEYLEYKLFWDEHILEPYRVHIDLTDNAYYPIQWRCTFEANAVYHNSYSIDNNSSIFPSFVSLVFNDGNGLIYYVIADSNYSFGSLSTREGHCTLAIPKLQNGFPFVCESFTFFAFTETSYTAGDRINSLIPEVSSVNEVYNLATLPALQSMSDYFINIGRDYEREQLTGLTNSAYTLKNIIFAIIDAPFYTLRSALDFNVFGVNLAGTIFSFCSLALLFCVIRKLRGR